MTTVNLFVEQLVAHFAQFASHCYNTPAAELVADFQKFIWTFFQNPNFTLWAGYFAGATMTVLIALFICQMFKRKYKLAPKNAIVLGGGHEASQVCDAMLELTPGEQATLRIAFNQYLEVRAIEAKKSEISDYNADTTL